MIADNCGKKYEKSCALIWMPKQKFRSWRDSNFDYVIISICVVNTQTVFNLFFIFYIFSYSRPKTEVHAKEIQVCTCANSRFECQVGHQN